jgi:endo-beta-N-acetylglucosaminidase D
VSNSWLLAGGQESMDEITNAPQEAMEKTPEELVIWVRERRPDDSYRQSIVQLEFERRVAVAQIETAKSAKLNSKWMLCSVIVLALTGVLAAVFQYLAWMYPHLAK